MMVEKAPWDVPTLPQQLPSARNSPSGPSAAPWDPPAAVEEAAPWDKPKAGPVNTTGTLFGDSKAETVFGELGAGLQQGARQVISTAPALAALAAQGFESVTGKSTHGLPQALIQTAEDISGGGAQRSIASVEDLRLMDPITWARYTAGTIGETIPFMLSVMSGAGAARWLATKMAEKGIAASTRASILGSIPSAELGAFGTSSAIEASATAQELHQATGNVDPLASLAAGSLKGVAESVFPMMLAREAGLLGGEATNALERMYMGIGNRAMKGLVGAGIEGATEAAQEEVDIQTRALLDAKYSAGDSLAWSRRLNALVGGAVGGGAFGALGLHNPHEALNDHEVRKAAGDIPIVTGQDVGELPTTGPQEAIRRAPLGGDVTVGAANELERQQLLSDFEPNRRGLYAAVIPGEETTFGTQDQATNDNAVLKGAGYVRLDPSKVTRGDLTVSVEDLPGTIASPRIDFLEKSTINEATAALTEAVKLKEAATQTRNTLETESLLSQAAKKYREAINFGARVEPLPDSQVILRDPNKIGTATNTAEGLKSQVTQAGLTHTRVFPDGKQLYVFDVNSQEQLNSPSAHMGRKIDLETVDPNTLTALPDRGLMQRMLASPEVSRQLNLGRARGMGIRFIGKRMDEVRAKALLRSFVRMAQSVTGGVPFHTQPAPIVERFMRLVDAGMRLDVKPDTAQFASLQQLGEKDLVNSTQQIGPRVAKDKDVTRIVKSRAKREREPRVARLVQFADGPTERLFLTQHHSNAIQTLLAGDVTGGKSNNSALAIKTSPIGNMLRSIAQSIGVKTDYVIEIHSPATMPNEGVKYVEKSVVLVNGKNAQPRSVIQVNPWYYTQDTTGGKELVKRDESWGGQGKRLYRVVGQTLAQGNRKIQDAAGNIVSLRDELKARNATPADMVLLDYSGDLSKPARVMAIGPYDALVAVLKPEIDSRTLAPGNGVEQKEWDKWISSPVGSDTPFPERGKQARSRIGKTADKLGVSNKKQFAPDENTAEFFADFAREFSQSIVTFEWGNTDVGMQDLIKTAYRREMHLQEGMDPEGRIARTVPHPVVDRAINNLRGAKFQEYNFEEWLVNQMARYLTQGREKAIGPVQEFFKKVGYRVKSAIGKLFEKVTGQVGPFNFDPNEGAPDAIVQKWLEQLQLRGVANATPPFLDDATRQALIANINKQQAKLAKLGINQYVVATPEKASTFQVKQLLKLLPTTPEFNESRGKLQGLLAMSDKFNSTMEQLLGLHQIADMNPHIEGLQVYKSATRAMENRSLGWASLADKRLREAQKLGETQLKGLWQLMFDLDHMVYLDQKKLAEGEIQPRWPLPEELLALVKNNGLNRNAFKVYLDIRSDFLQFISYLENTSIKQAQETITDPERLAERVKEIRGETEQIRQKPYFPHMRFGQYVVTVYGPKDKVLHFEAFQSKKARDEAMPGIVAKYKVPEGARIKEDELAEHLRQWQGLPGYALGSIKQALGLNVPDGELTKDQKSDKEKLEAMAASNMGTTSFRQQLKDRKNTPGYSMDGLRAYANYFARSSKFMARMEYQNTLEKAIASVRESGSPVSRDAMTRIADYMLRHYEAQMQPAGDYAEVRSLGFLWYFAFAPAAAFVNLTQVPMVSMPFLASKFGDVKTMGRVTQAYAQNTKEFYDWLRGKNQVAETSKQEAIEEAHFNRLLDDGFATELAAISQGPVLQRTIPGSAIARGLRRMAQWGTSPFSLAERINRSVTFRAAFDLALADNNNKWIDQLMVDNKIEADQLRIDRGWDEKTIRAYMAAADTVRRTQFEYGRWTRPKIMDGAKGVLFMFKNYLQNMLYFMFKSDRKTQVRFMLTMFATAGLMGMPGADDAAELAKWLAKEFGIDLDLERTVRSLMKGWGAGDYSDLALHGAAREGFGIPAALNGLGLPAPHVDLSGSLGMGRLIPGLKEGLNPNSAASSQEAIGNAVTQFAGPVLGVPFALYQALNDQALPASDPKRWEKVMPRALKSVSKASRYLAEGMERDRTGAPVYTFDPNDMNDQMDILVGVGLGFQPTKLNQTWDLITARKEVQDYWKGQRDILIREFWRGIDLKDQKAQAAAMDSIRRFNLEAPDPGLRISSDAIKASVRGKLLDRKFKELDINKQKTYRGIDKQTDTLYPEVSRRTVPMQ